MAQYPEFVRRCAERRLPFDQTLEVLFCNPPVEGTEHSADEWTRIYNTFRPLWDAARREQGVLRLAREVSPELASNVYEKLPADNAAVFLFSSWPQHLRPASESLAKLGQGGLYVLELYGDEKKNLNRTRFESLLANHSWRTVLYTLAYGDMGLEAMAANPNAFDKDFNPDGTPKEKEFWTKLPLVGAMGDLVRNLAHNRPVSWEEVGWAGLDVADGALLVASFGASAPLTAAKGAAKSGVREFARQEVKAVARSAVGKTGRAGAVTAIKTKTAKSLLRSWSEAVATGRIAKGVTGSLKVTGWTIRTLAAVGLKTGRVAAAAWNAVPEPVRKFIRRGLLAASLIAVLLERTIPEIFNRIQAGIPAWIDSLRDGASKSLAELMSKAIESVTGGTFPAEALASWFRASFPYLLLAAGTVGLGIWYGRHRRAKRRATRG